MLRVTHKRRVHMEQDRFTQMAGDIEGLDTAKFCKSSGHLFRGGVHGPGAVAESDHPIFFKLDGSEEAKLAADLKLTAGVFFAMRAEEDRACTDLDGQIAQGKLASHVRPEMGSLLRHTRRGRYTEP